MVQEEEVSSSVHFMLWMQNIWMNLRRAALGGLQSKKEKAQKDSPTAIRTPAGWFKVNSANHYTMGDDTKKAQNKVYTDVILWYFLPQKPKRRDREAEARICTCLIIA